MSEFKELFSRLENETTLERRAFLRNSLVTGVALSPLAHLFQQAFAQLAGEEITVYGEDPNEAARRLEKMQASAAANTARDMGNASLGLAAVSLGLAGAFLEVPPAAVILTIDGAIFIISGFGFYFLAYMLELVAADPPRYPYQIDEVFEGFYFIAQLLDKVQVGADKALLTSTNTLVTSLRAVWDHLEWWQAAKEEQDSKWMQIHADKFWANFDTFAAELQELPKTLRAAVESLQSRLTIPNNGTIFDATKQIAGKNLQDLLPLKEVITKAIDWDSKLFDDGIREQVRDGLKNVVLQPVSQADFKALLDDLEQHASYFASV